MNDQENVLTLKPYLAERLKCQINSFFQLSGGRNSRVYHLQCDDGKSFALKVYFRDADDRRDRLAAEWTAYALMARYRLPHIPSPVFKDETKGIAVYEFIPGKRLMPEQITRRHIDVFVSFLSFLESVKRDPMNDRILPASEAAFSVSAVMNIIDRRLDRLKTACDAEKRCPELYDFLHRKLLPFYDEIKVWCLEKAQQLDMDIHREIDVANRTLSPSDYGFHNALETEDGRLYIFDFEYFGWDDPAKMIVDFFLHPAVNVKEELRYYFVERMLSRLNHIHGLGSRITLVYPLFGIKWCLILLNEFIPSEVRRRHFANAEGDDSRPTKENQLEKALQMFSYITETYKEFCYGG